MTEPLKTANKLLIVDDEDDVRDVMMDAASAMGYEVLGAGDGRKALEILKSTPIDIITSDKNMPRYSGFQFLADCHKENIFRPFIFLTGEDAVDGVIAAVRLGAVDFVVKPIDFLELEKTLKRASALAALWAYEETLLAAVAKQIDGNSDTIRSALREHIKLLRAV